MIEVTIVGDTPLKVHRIGKKYQQELDDKDHGKPKKKNVERDYDYEFRDSLYIIDKNGCQIDGPVPEKLTPKMQFGFPSSSIKKAMVYSARQFGKDVKMSELKGRFFVNQFSPFFEIKGTPKIDKFMRRIGGSGPGTGTPDNGIRASFDVWSATLEIRFLKNLITAESVLNLLSVAGFSVGIGEDRPDKTGGTCGMWHIKGQK